MTLLFQVDMQVTFLLVGNLVIYDLFYGPVTLLPLLRTYTQIYDCSLNYINICLHLNDISDVSSTLLCLWPVKNWFFFHALTHS